MTKSTSGAIYLSKKYALIRKKEDKNSAKLHSCPLNRNFTEKTEITFADITLRGANVQFQITLRDREVGFMEYPLDETEEVMTPFQRLRMGDNGTEDRMREVLKFPEDICYLEHIVSVIKQVTKDLYVPDHLEN